MQAPVDKYTYEICPYGSARQKESGSTTSLGNWGGWENNYSTMKFQGGTTCWQGPDRSITVRAARDAQLGAGGAWHAGL